MEGVGIKRVSFFLSFLYNKNMKIVIIEQKPGLSALYDVDTNSIIARDVTDVVEEVLNIYRPIIAESIVKSDISWEEAQVFSGEIKCCDCGATVDKYNSQWPMARQRCNLCLI